MPFLNLLRGYFVPFSITCVNSMEVSYIPIAKARGFTTHWIKHIKKAEQNVESEMLLPK